MSERRSVVWGAEGAEIQLEVWREKLQATEGNISRAGAALGFTKSYAMRLTKRHGLNEYAAGLRRAALGRTHGRPWDDGSR